MRLRSIQKRWAGRRNRCVLSSVEAGFDRHAPNKPVTAGLEVFRELLDKEDKPVTRTKLGEPIHVVCASAV